MLIAANSNDTVTYTCKSSNDDPNLLVEWDLAGEQTLKSTPLFSIEGDKYLITIVVTNPKEFDSELGCVLRSNSTCYGTCPALDHPVYIITYSEWLSQHYVKSG